MAAVDSSSKLLAVGFASATASAALTYALLRLKPQLFSRGTAAGRDAGDHSSCCGSAPAKRDPYDASPRTGWGRRWNGVERNACGLQ